MFTKVVRVSNVAFSPLLANGTCQAVVALQGDNFAMQVITHNGDPMCQIQGDFEVSFTPLEAVGQESDPQPTNEYPMPVTEPQDGTESPPSAGVEGSTGSSVEASGSAEVPTQPAEDISAEKPEGDING